MNRRDFLAGLVCAVATLSLDVGARLRWRSLLRRKRCPQSQSLKTTSLGSSWITCDEDGAEAVAVVIGTTDIIGTGAIIVATANARVEPGTGRRGRDVSEPRAVRPSPVWRKPSRRDGWY